MAITAKVEGMDEISEMLTALEENAQGAAAAGLYDGAGVMADAINKSVDEIQRAPFHYAALISRLPSPEEVDAIRGAVGIAKFDKNGAEVQTSIGFANAGYADVAGKRKPIALIANSINSGTSFMQKQPFFRKGVSKGSKRAEAAIIKSIEQRLDEKNLK